MLVPHQSPARPSESPHTGLVGFSFRLCVLAFHSMFRTAGTPPTCTCAGALFLCGPPARRWEYVGVCGDSLLGVSVCNNQYP